MPLKQGIAYPLFFFALCIVVGSGLFLLLVLPYSMAEKETAQRKEKLLAADHRSILAECRKMMPLKSIFRKDPSWSGSRTPGAHDRVYIDPEDPAIPAAIRDLEPLSIMVSDERVTIELHGMSECFGVHALKEGEQRENLAEKELTPGLWYFCHTRH